MKHTRLLTLASTLATVLLTLGTAAPAAAGEMKMEFDTTTEPRLFLGRFARYGYNPMKTMLTDNKGGLRFVLPSGTKGIGQTGLYSHFAMWGDFEIVVSYEWNNVTAPRDGYGVSCGIAIEREHIPPVGQIKSLSLARGHAPDKRGEGYFVTQEVITENKEKPDYPTEHFPNRAKKGKLAMRREKDEVIFLVADSPKDELRELTRVAFTEATIRKVRVYADQGGSMTYLDTKIPDLRVRAEEITGGVPIREQTFAWGWWLTIACFVIIGSILFVLYRREKRGDDDDEPTPAKKRTSSIRPGRPR